jgi:hypothetical protein
MPTIVTKTIGTTGRDYSTIQAWEDACPSNLVTADQVWKGTLYNDSEFTAGVTISGQTTDSTRYVWLTTEPGQSFRDHATATTNALTYDQTKGVGIKASPAAYILDVQAANTLVENIQVYRNGTYNYIDSAVSLTGSGAKLNNSIVKSDSARSNVFVAVSATGAAINNCLLLATTTQSNGAKVAFGGSADSCTIVKSSAVSESGTGVTSSYANNVLKNCAVFNFSTAQSGGTFTGSGNNATNKASGLPGTGNVYSLTASNQFQSTINDFRLKSGAGLIDAGNTSLTTDIIGQARSTPDIGAWEYTSSSISLVGANATGAPVSTPSRCAKPTC